MAYGPWTDQLRTVIEDPDMELDIPWPFLDNRGGNHEGEMASRLSHPAQATAKLWYAGPPGTRGRYPIGPRCTRRQAVWGGRAWRGCRDAVQALRYLSEAQLRVKHPWMQVVLEMDHLKGLVMFIILFPLTLPWPLSPPLHARDCILKQAVLVHGLNFLCRICTSS